MNLSRSALFHTKPRVCLKYFMNDLGIKRDLVPPSFQVYLIQIPQTGLYITFQHRQYHTNLDEMRISQFTVSIVGGLLPYLRMEIYHYFIFYIQGLLYLLTCTSSFPVLIQRVIRISNKTVLCLFEKHNNLRLPFCIA